MQGNPVGSGPRQVEALKNYRSKGEQRMVVQHVNVAEGGQAIVGDVSAPAPGVGVHQKAKEQPHARAGRRDATRNRSGAGYGAARQPCGGIASVACMALVAGLLGAIRTR